MYSNNQHGRDLSWECQPSDTNHQLKPSINTEVVVNPNIVAWISVKILAAYQMQYIAQ